MITKPLKIICAGLIGWDTIGQTNFNMVKGNDLPGKIETSIGGVAANIAVALANHCNKNKNFEIILLSSTGNDKKSDLLLSILAKHNKINCNNVIREEGTSDGYVGLEFKGELFGAIASSSQLEKSCIKIFEPFARLIRSEKNLPFENFLIVDSNLTVKAIDHLTFDPIFDKTNFIIACASPYKAKKIRNLMIRRKCSIYSNLNEASAISGSKLSSSQEAADVLFQMGAKDATVTNGKKAASNRSTSGLVSLTPKQTFNIKATGAGDAFLSAHFLSILLNREATQLKHLETAELAAREGIPFLLER